MTRIVRVATVVALGLMVGGCWGITPTDERGLVSVVAVDRAPQGYQVTLGIVNPLSLPKPGSSGSGGSSSPPLLVRSITAPSVADALYAAQEHSQLRLDFAHVDSVLVSEEVARAGLYPTLDLFDTSLENTPSAWLIVTRGEPAGNEIRMGQAVLPQLGQATNLLVERARLYSALQAERVQTFLSLAQVPGQSPVTIGMRVDQTNGGGAEASLRVDGLAVFRGDRLVGWLSDEAALGWAMLAGRNGRLALPSVAGARFAVEVRAVRRHADVRPGPAIAVQTSVDGQLTAVQGVATDFLAQPKQTDDVETAAAAQIVRVEQLALTTCQRFGADPFGYGELVRVRDPRDWPREEASWPTEGFRRSVMSLSARVRLRGYGLDMRHP